MPTAGKLIGAVLFAAVTWYVSELIKPLLPEGTAVGLLSPINAFFGLLMGWRILGARAGDGLVGTIGHGATTAVATVFLCLLAWGGNQMYENAIRKFYNGPIHALQDMAVIMIDYAVLAATPATVGALLVGTLLASWITEIFAQRWS